MVIDLASTASEHGLSKYFGYFECARKKQLDGPFNGTVPKKDNLLVGTMTHKLLQLYRQGVQFPGDAQFTWNGESLSDRQEARDEAFRLFQDYRLHFSASELGEVIGTEIPLGVDDFLDTGFPLTGAADCVVRVGPEHVKGILQNRKVEVRPGLYIVDDKTEARIDKTTADKFRHAPQFPAYMALWNMTHEEQIAGTIVNVIGKTKVPNYLTVVIPTPGVSEIKMLHDIVKRAGAIHARDLAGEELECNQRACVANWGTCHHLTSGACLRF